jgi:hypothetical protein
MRLGSASRSALHALIPFRAFGLSRFRDSRAPHRAAAGTAPRQAPRCGCRNEITKREHESTTERKYESDEVACQEVLRRCMNQPLAFLEVLNDGTRRSSPAPQ